MRSLPVVLVVSVLAAGCGGGGSTGSTAAPCPSTQVMCGAVCVDPQTDRQHCGASGDCAGASAGTACAGGQVCSVGHCALSCQSTRVACDGGCIDPATDRSHCGASGDCAGANAGATCGAGEVCSGGHCALTCQATQVACDGTCIDPRTDRAHCGATGDCTGAGAGTACANGQVCSGGRCALSCQDSLVACDGTCIDPSTDRDHCGASGACAAGTAQAGAACQAGELCQGGRCVHTCPGAQIACNGECVDPDLDRAHCGATGDCAGANAGATCAAGMVCSGGQCQLTCQTGLVNCGGTCIDPRTDRQHCGVDGACAGGAVCAAGSICTDRQCVPSCPAGEYACGGGCIDPSTDATYCGAASDCTGGATCGAGTACIHGVCTACGATQAACAGQCVDPATSHDHCGASGLCQGAQAGVACRADQVCSGGQCACPSGTVACGGACVDPQRDDAFCGASGSCTGGSAGQACGPDQVCEQGACSTLHPFDWRPARLRTAPPHFVEDASTLAHIVFDGDQMKMIDRTGNTHWTMVGAVGATENGMWSPPQSWSGPFTQSAFWMGDAATKTFLDANTSGDFTVCARYKPGAHPLASPNKIIIANGKAEGSDLDVGGWALMQMHDCSCFHYHDDYFADCTSSGGRQQCAHHGEWMAPSCGTISAESLATLEWTWQCGGRAGAGLRTLRESWFGGDTYAMGGQSGSMGAFHPSAQLPTIGNYADGTGPLWDGGVYEIIVSSLPATDANMRGIVARASGGVAQRNEGPAALPGADGKVHLGAPSSLRVQSGGYVVEDQAVTIAGSIGAPASAGECFGYDVSVDDWTALSTWQEPMTIAAADGSTSTSVFWFNPVSDHALVVQIPGNANFSVDGRPPGTYGVLSRHAFLWCFDAADGKVRGYADGGSTPFAESATSLPAFKFPNLQDPATAVNLTIVSPQVRLYRFWACPGSAPASCW